MTFIHLLDRNTISSVEGAVRDVMSGSKRLAHLLSGHALQKIQTRGKLQEPCRARAFRRRKGGDMKAAIALQ
jgi:hypothetical protein